MRRAVEPTRGRGRNSWDEKDTNTTRPSRNPSDEKCVPLGGHRETALGGGLNLG